jgi:hypothetical protein
MQSLAGRLLFSVTLFLLAMAVPVGATGDWAGIREQLVISTWIGGAGLALVLLVLIIRGRRDDQTGSAAATSSSWQSRIRSVFNGLE